MTAKIDKTSDRPPAAKPLAGNLISVDGTIDSTAEQALVLARKKEKEKELAERDKRLAPPTKADRAT